MAAMAIVLGTKYVLTIDIGVGVGTTAGVTCCTIIPFFAFRPLHVEY